MTTRVAMWSGPRNISTAMMRAWGNRADTVVVDEPFYAYYLAATGIAHPGAREIMAQGACSWPRVVAALRTELPPGRTVQFEKQMTLHLLPEVDRSWLGEVINCFLIREPRDVIISYARKRPDLELADLGFVQQAELFDWVCRHTDQDPPVIDARDVQNHPEVVLSRLCDRIGIGFDPAMLAWAAGRRDTDGMWAPHWYEAVEASTGFTPYREGSRAIPEGCEEVYRVGLDTYRKLYDRRIRPDG